jgi:hypothetical protein
MDLKEAGRRSVGWIHQDQDREQQWDFVNMVS